MDRVVFAGALEPHASRQGQRKKTHDVALLEGNDGGLAGDCRGTPRRRLRRLVDPGAASDEKAGQNETRETSGNLAAFAVLRLTRLPQIPNAANETDQRRHIHW